MLNLSKISNGYRATRMASWCKLAGQFRRSRDGAAAIEFAILAIPYFMIIFAILETFIAFWGEELVANAVQTMSRELRTGNITYNLGRDNNMTEKQFRAAFCDEVSILISCTQEEINTPARLFLDIRNFKTFADIPTAIPRTSSETSAPLDTSTFAYNPGGPGTINMMRAYYKWHVITDLIRPYISNVRPEEGSRPTDFLIVETTAFVNEDYP